MFLKESLDMKKENLGKIIIGIGIALIAIPLLTAIIYDISLFFRIGRLAGNLRNNLFMRGSPNVFLKWVGSIIYISSFGISNIQVFFQRIFLQNVLWLFMPNLFVISGFYFLLKQKQNIDIKECFNKMVIIGLALNVLVLFNFFGLYNIVYNRFQRSFYVGRWLSFIPRNILYTSVGRFIYNLSLLLVSLLFRIILVAPTFAIFAGYMQFFKKQETTSAVNENTVSEKLQSSVSVAPTSFNNLSLSKMMLEFKGGVLPIFLFPFWFVPFMGITFGLALPWIICIVIRWVCENTTIGGKQLSFKGTGGGLIGRYILWSILTFITLGIYGYWAIRNYIRWAIENVEVSLPKLSSEVSSTNTPYTPPINRNYGEIWTCKKCSEENPMASSSCKGCGAYK
jgi:hypothetical protein